MGKVLVVDDEIDICTLLARQLEKLGHEVTYCLTISDALKDLSFNSYDIIFADLHLSDGSGYDLIAAMKELKRTSRIIVISAYDSERQKAIQAGASSFVAKPFSKKSIGEALDKLNYLTNTQSP